MTRNLGRLDQAIRVLAGLALIAFGLTDQSPWRWLGLVGIVLVVTGLVRFCPLYRLVGVKTCAGPACAGPAQDRGGSSQGAFPG